MNDQRASVPSMKWTAVRRPVRKAYRSTSVDRYRESMAGESTGLVELIVICSQDVGMESIVVGEMWMLSADTTESDGPPGV